MGTTTTTKPPKHRKVRVIWKQTVEIKSNTLIVNKTVNGLNSWVKRKGLSDLT